MKRLAIVGSYPENRHLVPFEDEMTEIWVFNEAPQAGWVMRWDACFQLHSPEIYSSPNNFVNKAHWEWLQQSHGKRIYMQAADPCVPDSVAYPLAEVLEMIPYRYLRSSIAMALALAIYQGTWEEIGLYGINLVSNTEYGYQATNMAFWIGFAHGRGVNLQLRCWLDEFNQPVYGYDGAVQLDPAYFDGRVRELDPAWRHNDKALKAIKADVEKAMLAGDCQKVAALTLQVETVALAAGETAGALGEAERYAGRDDPIPRQEFEKTSAVAQKEGEALRTLMNQGAGKAEYVWNVWKQTGQIQALQQLRKFLAENAKYAYDCGARKGIWMENIQYMREFDDRVLAAGGVRTLSALGRLPNAQPAVRPAAEPALVR